MHELAGNRSAPLRPHVDSAAVPLFAMPFPETPPPIEAPRVEFAAHTPAPARAAPSVSKQPLGLFIVCGAELCERFGGCLLLSLLVLFFTEQLGVASAVAVRRVSLFSALGYLAALAGGWFVGRVFAARRCATLGALLLAAGFAVLATERRAVLPLALALLVAGSGLFRPSITTLLDQLYPRQDRRRDAGHIWFWIAVNAGSALAPLTAGVLRAAAGWRAAFLAATISAVLCALVLVAGRRYLPAEMQPDLGESSRISPEDLDAPPNRTRQMRMLVAVGFATLLYMVASGQLDGTLLLWARDHTDRVLLGHAVPVAWFSSVPAILVLLLGPILLTATSKLRGRDSEPSALRKVAVGLVMAGLAYGVMALAAANGDRSGSPLWLLGCFALLVIGELLVVPLGLALMIKLVPRRYAGLMSGLWCVVIAAGYFIAGEVGALLQQAHPSLSFALLGVTLLGGAACVGLVARSKAKRPRLS